jgi:hypothetical protein
MSVGNWWHPAGPTGTYCLDNAGRPLWKCPLSSRRIGVTKTIAASIPGERLRHWENAGRRPGTSCRLSPWSTPSPVRGRSDSYWSGEPLPPRLAYRISQLGNHSNADRPTRASRRGQAGNGGAPSPLFVASPARSTGTGIRVHRAGDKALDSRHRSTTLRFSQSHRGQAHDRIPDRPRST